MTPGRGAAELEPLYRRLQRVRGARAAAHGQPVQDAQGLCGQALELVQSGTYL